MSLRFARSTGPALLALSGIALAFGFAGPGPPAAAATEAVFSLLSQPSTSVAPGQPFVVDVALPAATPPSADLTVTLSDKLETRSAFDQTLSGPPPGDVLDRTPPVPVSTLTARRGGVELSVAVFARTPATRRSPAAPYLVLGCTPDTGACSGVYPATVTLTRPGGGGTLGRFTTYLTYAEARSAQPLRFAWVVPVSTPVTVRSSTDPVRALPPPGPRQVAAVATLAAALAGSSVPVTVEPSPETVQALAGVSGADAPTARAALDDLADLSADQQVHQVPQEPYVDVDASALAGEPTELNAQMLEGAPVLRHAGIQTTPTAEPGTWVADGPVSPALGSSLRWLRASRVVVPDSSLTTPTGASSGITWAYPFSLTLGRAGSVPALASDSQLGAHFSAEAADPALAANQLLADLAFIHFEQPNLADPRGVVATPPAGWVPRAAFDAELLHGLRANPDVEPVTLDGLFDQVPVGGNGAPRTRSLAPAGGPTLPRGLAHQISSGRLRLSAFVSAVPSHPPVLSQLDNILLASQSVTLGAAGQRAGVATFERVLGAQLSLIQVATERTITETARTAAIPVTVISNAPYTVVGTLTLSSAKFTFPPPGPKRPGVVLNHPTTPLRIEAQARTSGDLPLEATFVSPSGSLQIARGQLTVRSTATSWVGVVLTALALAVLGAWWARTWWAGRRAKRAEDGGR